MRDNVFQIKDNIVEKNSLENKENIINYVKEETKTLIHYNDLIEKIENEKKKKKELNIDGDIKGLIVFQKINNLGNRILDSFDVKFIY